MGPELRKVADTIMPDLGMGEDQGKIDALEQYLQRCPLLILTTTTT